MAIVTGRNGSVQIDPTNASPLSLATIASVNMWKLSLATNYEDVSCFGDTNKVYVPGLRDISGSIGGFWNSSDTKLVDASSQSTPSWLRLTPNSTESTFIFEGLAYLDASLDCSMNAPKISGTFKAGGPWTTP
jgi:hypothetical protein